MHMAMYLEGTRPATKTPQYERGIEMDDTSINRDGVCADVEMTDIRPSARHQPRRADLIQLVNFAIKTSQKMKRQRKQQQQQHYRQVVQPERRFIQVIERIFAGDFLNSSSNGRILTKLIKALVAAISSVARRRPAGTHGNHARRWLSTNRRAFLKLKSIGYKSHSVAGSRRARPLDLDEQGEQEQLGHKAHISKLHAEWVLEEAFPYKRRRTKVEYAKLDQTIVAPTLDETRPRIKDTRPTILRAPRWVNRQFKYNGNDVLHGKQATDYQMRKSRWAPECFTLVRQSTMDSIHSAMMRHATAATTQISSPKVYRPLKAIPMDELESLFEDLAIADDDHLPWWTGKVGRNSSTGNVVSTLTSAFSHKDIFSSQALSAHSSLTPIAPQPKQMDMALTVLNDKHTVPSSARPETTSTINPAIRANSVAENAASLNATKVMKNKSVSNEVSNTPSMLMQAPTSEVRKNEIDLGIPLPVQTTQTRVVGDHQIFSVPGLSLLKDQRSTKAKNDMTASLASSQKHVANKTAKTPPLRIKISGLKTGSLKVLPHSTHEKISDEDDSASDTVQKQRPISASVQRTLQTTITNTSPFITENAIKHSGKADSPVDQVHSAPQLRTSTIGAIGPTELNVLQPAKANVPKPSVSAARPYSAVATLPSQDDTSRSIVASSSSDRNVPQSVPIITPVQADAISAENIHTSNRMTPKSPGVTASSYSSIAGGPVEDQRSIKAAAPPTTVGPTSFMKLSFDVCSTGGFKVASSSSSNGPALHTRNIDIDVPSAGREAVTSPTNIPPMTDTHTPIRSNTTTAPTENRSRQVSLHSTQPQPQTIKNFLTSFLPYPESLLQSNEEMVLSAPADLAVDVDMGESTATSTNTSYSPASDDFWGSAPNVSTSSQATSEMVESDTEMENFAEALPSHLEDCTVQEIAVDSALPMDTEHSIRSTLASSSVFQTNKSNLTILKNAGIVEAYQPVTDTSTTDLQVEIQVSPSIMRDARQPSDKQQPQHNASINTLRKVEEDGAESFPDPLKKLGWRLSANGQQDKLVEQLKNKDKEEVEGEDDIEDASQSPTTTMFTTITSSSRVPSQSSDRLRTSVTEPSEVNIGSKRKLDRTTTDDDDGPESAQFAPAKKPMAQKSTIKAIIKGPSLREFAPESGFVPRTWSRTKTYRPILKQNTAPVRKPFAVSPIICKKGDDDNAGGPYWDTLKLLRDKFAQLVYWDDQVKEWFIQLMNQCRWFDGESEEYQPRWVMNEDDAPLVVDTLFELADHEPGAMAGECVPTLPDSRPEDFDDFHHDLGLMVQLRPYLWQHLVGALLQMNISLVTMLGGESNVEEKDSLRLIQPSDYIFDVRKVDDLDAQRSNGWKVYDELYDWTQLDGTDRHDFNALIYMIVRDGYFGEFSIFLTNWIDEDEENRELFQDIIEKAGLIRWDDEDCYMAIFPKLDDYLGTRLPVANQREKQSIKTLFRRCVEWRYPRWYQRTWPEEREDEFLDWIIDGEDIALEDVDFEMD